MQAFSFLLLLTSYWLLSTLFWAVEDSSALSEQDVLDNLFNQLRVYEHTFDGIEVPILSRSDLDQFYVSTEKSNVSLWYSITPCNNYIDEWYIKVNSHAGWKKYKSKPMMKYETKSRNRTANDVQHRNNPNAIAKQIHGFLDGDTGKRFHNQIDGYIRKIPSSSLLMSIKSPPNTLILVFLSIRYSTKEPFVGYPRIHKSLGTRTTKMCVTSGHKLRISFAPASSTEMDRVDYCVAINSERPLPHRCSAHMFIDPDKMPPQEKVRAMLKNFLSSSRKLKSAHYKCVSKPPILFENLTLNKTRYFINIYAVNRRSDLASSYSTVIWDPSEYRFKSCDRNVIQLKIKSSGNHKDHFQRVRLTTDLYINLTGPPPVSTAFNSMWYLWFQPCKSPPKGSRYDIAVEALDTMDKIYTREAEKFRCHRTFNRQPDNVCRIKGQVRWLPAPGAYKLTVRNEAVQELSNIVGQMILSHKSTIGNLFPYRGRSKESMKNSRQPLELSFDCSNNHLSATVYAYRHQTYCFYLKEEDDRTSNLKKFKRKIARSIDLCTPVDLSYIEKKCINGSYSSADHFSRRGVNFDYVLQNGTGYIVYVYYGITRGHDDDYTHRGTNVPIFPFYAFKYVSVTLKHRRCARGPRKTSRTSRKNRYLSSFRRKYA